MAFTVNITAQAKLSLDKIIDFLIDIDISNIEYAFNLSEKILQKAFSLNQHPFKGKVCEEGRVLIYKSYLIFYSVDKPENQIYILRIAHSKDYPEYSHLL